MMTTTTWPVRRDASKVGPDLAQLNRLVVEQVQGPLEAATLRGVETGSMDPTAEARYDCFEPVQLVFVALEPAATSPFMDC